MIRRSGRIVPHGRGRRRTRTITLIGRIRNAPAATYATLIVSDGKGADGTSVKLWLNADGSFRKRVTIGTGAVTVRVWYPGDVQPTRTVRPAASRRLRIPGW